MSLLRKLYLAFSVAIVAVFGLHSDTGAPTREKQESEQPKAEKKFRAPFLPK